MGLRERLLTTVERALDDVRGVARRALGVPAEPPTRSAKARGWRAPERGDDERHVTLRGEAFATRVPVLEDWDVETVRDALRSHEMGDTRASALFADHMGRNDRVGGVLGTRVNAILGLPHELTLGRGDAAEAAHAELKEAWPRIVTRGATAACLRTMVMMGFVICQRVWQLDVVTGRWELRLVPWHATWVTWDETTHAFRISTRDGVEYCPLDGSNPRWSCLPLYDGERPWMAGAVRPLAVPFLVIAWAYRDAARWSEKHGLPPLAAKVPWTQRDSNETRQFLRDLLTLSTEPTILLGQYDSPKPSFDLEWKELKNWQSYEGFLELANRMETNVSIFLLGQNLSTEVQGGSFAAAKAHERVRMDYLEADATALSSGLRAAAAVPWTRVNVTDVAAELAAPTPTYDTAIHTEGPITPDYVEKGIVTPDEARARLGLPALPDGAGATVREPVAPATDPLMGLLSAPSPALTARTRARAANRTHRGVDADVAQDNADEGLEICDELRERLVDLLSTAHGPQAAAIVEAVRTAKHPSEVRARVKALLREGIDPELEADVARAIVLSRLAGRLSAQRAVTEATTSKGRPR